MGNRSFAEVYSFLWKHSELWKTRRQHSLIKILLQDYVLTIAVNLPDSKLNMELVLKDKKASGNIDVKPDNYVKPKHGKVRTQFEILKSDYFKKSTPIG